MRSPLVMDNSEALVATKSALHTAVTIDGAFMASVVARFFGLGGAILLEGSTNCWALRARILLGAGCGAFDGGFNDCLRRLLGNGGGAGTDGSRC